MTTQEIMNIFTILVGLTNIALILYGVFLTRNHFKILRTFSFIERFNSEEFRKHKVNFEIVISELQNAEDKNEYLEELHNSNERELIEKRTSIYKFLNILQEVSAAYSLGIIHKKALLKTFGSIIPRFFFPAKDIVEICRRRGNDMTIYGTLETVAKQINKEFEYDYEKDAKISYLKTEPTLSLEKYITQEIELADNVNQF